MKRSIIRYGFRAFIIGGLLFLMSLTLGGGLDYGIQAVLGYSSIVISLLLVYFGIRYYRDNENQGKLSFGQAIVLGLAISAAAGLAFAIVDFIYTTAINPDFFNDYSNSMKASGEDIQEMSSGFMAAVMFATVLVIGFIISIISAIILQRK